MIIVRYPEGAFWLLSIICDNRKASKKYQLKLEMLLRLSSLNNRKLPIVNESNVASSVTPDTERSECTCIYTYIQNDRTASFVLVKMK